MCSAVVIMTQHETILIFSSMESIFTLGASQSAPLFSSQGTDQGVGHFKSCLNHEIILVHWNVGSLKIPQCITNSR